VVGRANSAGGELEAIFLAGMRADANFVGNLLRRLRAPEMSTGSPQLMMALGSYLSLFVYEGQKKLASLDKQNHRSLSVTAQEVVARSRHSLKLFEDTKKGIDGLIKEFGGEIVQTHRDYFVSFIRFAWARGLVTDLGIYRYNGRIISTTHAATFALGIPAVEISDDQLGERTFSVSEEYGSYFGSLGASLGGPDTFDALPSMDPGRFTSRPEDVNSKRYYARIFNGAKTPELNAVLLLLLSQVNLIDQIVDGRSVSEHADYSTFKIRFLTIYQVLRSLEILRMEKTGSLNEVSRELINGVLDTDPARLILHEGMRPLRNSLMHYNLDTRIEAEFVDPANLLPTLLEVAWSEKSGAEIRLATSESLKALVAAMNAWFSQGIGGARGAT
jgi:hypothetical protein